MSNTSENQVAVPVKRVAHTMEIHPEVMDDAPMMSAVDASARVKLETYCQEAEVDHAGFVMTMVGDVRREIVASIFVRDIRVPAPRRWWHRVLFRHPMTTETRRDTRPGHVPNADYYRIGWEVRAAECPPGMVPLRIRDDLSAIKFARP